MIRCLFGINLMILFVGCRQVWWLDAKSYYGGWSSHLFRTKVAAADAAAAAAADDDDGNDDDDEDDDDSVN